MKYIMYPKFLLLVLLLCTGGYLSAQSTVTGTVIDGDSDEPLIGATIVVKGKLIGTTTDLDGNFTLQTSEPVPFTLVFSGVGLETQEIQITKATQDVKVTLEAQAITIGNDIVVSASRVEEKILESAVTIEKMDAISIRQSATADYYDEIGKLKGVHTNQGSLTFTTVNTRGFASISNTRFVQWMDGMDNAAPLLNFPTGNIVGISELDIANVELVPGAASALYGPNAFNGILLMNSKSPFDNQGLSFQYKIGFTHSRGDDNQEWEDMGMPIERKFNAMNPMQNAAVRYAKSFAKDRLAFKVNFSILSAQDWPANDYTTDRLTGTRDRIGHQTFDGMNTYGDEFTIPVNIAASRAGIAQALTPAFAAGAGLPEPLVNGIIQSLLTDYAPIGMNRTGFREQDLWDNNDARSIKADAALHWRMTDKIEASLSYRFGSGASIYQGSERYALRNFSQQFAKAEIKGSNFFLRSYLSQTNAGDSYNFTALGTLMNENFAPTASAWGPTYAGAYSAAMLQYQLSTFPAVIPYANIPEAVKQNAHAFARSQADGLIPAVGSDEFNRVREMVRDSFFQRNGSSFIDNSRLWHTEAFYDFSQWTKNIIDVQVGGNFRQYDLFTEGTVFNEDPDGDGVNERIKINEFGAYVQVIRRLFNERLKLTGSLRYDKNSNFDGQITPRVSAVYSLGAKREHNFRASFQTGFRNPDTQAQFIYFPTTSILLGGTQENAERYGLYNGGAWTAASFAAFQATGDSSRLVTLDMDYVKPEKLTSYELGYKAILGGKLFVDVSGYFNQYKDFISQVTVYNKVPTRHKGELVGLSGNGIAAWRAYTNEPADILSWGASIGMNYRLPKGFTLGGNYSFADFSIDSVSIANGFEPGFNTPMHRFNVSLEQRNELIKNFGFVISYRWQDAFYWQNSFASGPVKAFGSLDLQVNYTVKKAKTTFKLGATNVLGPEYQTNTGGPFVGRMAYLSVTFDEFMR
jgi:outer membrane receptor protein involved in Fe transport